MWLPQHLSAGPEGHAERLRDQVVVHALPQQRQAPGQRAQQVDQLLRRELVSAAGHPRRQRARLLDHPAASVCLARYQDGMTCFVSRYVLDGMDCFVQRETVRGELSAGWTSIAKRCLATRNVRPICQKLLLSHAIKDWLQIFRAPMLRLQDAVARA